MKNGITLSPFREEWLGIFHEEKGRLRDALDRNCVAIHHVGGTAVRGLSSRPVIDILAVVRDAALVERHERVLTSLGYIRDGEERVYRKGDSFVLYLCETRERERIAGFLGVREYLNDFSASAEEYTKIKLSFCEEASAYETAKRAFLEKIGRDASRYYKRQSRLILSLCVCALLGAFAGLAVGAAFDSGENGAFLGLLLGAAVGTLPRLIRHRRRKEK